MQLALDCPAVSCRYERAGPVRPVARHDSRKLWIQMFVQIHLRVAPVDKLPTGDLDLDERFPRSTLSPRVDDPVAPDRWLERTNTADGFLPDVTDHSATCERRHLFGWRPE